MPFSGPWVYSKFSGGVCGADARALAPEVAVRRRQAGPQRKTTTTTSSPEHTSSLAADPTMEKSVKITLKDSPPQHASSAKDKASSSKDNLMLLGMDLSVFTPLQRFLICCTGVFFFYLIYGYCQELIFTLEGFKPFGWYLTLIQFGYYVIFGVFERQMLTPEATRKIPLRTYFLLALLTVATMGLSNSSLGYLNYPTQVIFKCCKLIPVLIGGILIQGKRFNIYDWLACFCMSVGLIFFTLADSTVQPSFSTYGVTLISLALCSDAVIGNVQERAMREHSASNSEVVLYSYGIGFLYILAGQLLTGQFFQAFTFCLQHPIRTYVYGFIFSLTGYLGLLIVLTLVKTSGALLAVTVTTCRKALTIVISFLMFAKPFTYQYLWSGMIVILGIYLNIYSKNQVKMEAMFRQLYERQILQRRPVSIVSNQDHIV